MSITIQGLVSRVSRFAAILGLLAAGTASAQAPSDNAIERIDATQTTTVVVVTIELKNPPAGVPASFSVANPARVALDLPQTVNGLGKNLVELNQGDVRSVNVVQSGGRSRVVVNLKRPVTHNITVDGPTTSMRVEMYESWIIAEYGIRCIMGKGGMGSRTLHALKEFGCVYLHTIGGAAVYLADRVKSVSGVWKREEFGMAEAMWILEVNDFPAIVTMDASYGKSLHDEIEMRSGKVLKELLGSNRF